MQGFKNKKKLANRPDGYLGLGNRYRLGEASFNLYHLSEMEGADKAANLTPELRDSFRLSVDAAAIQIGFQRALIGLRPGQKCPDQWYRPRMVADLSLIPI